MRYKVFLSTFLISTTTFIIWLMFPIKIRKTDYKKESVQLQKDFDARESAVVTTDRPLVTRNVSFYQKEITQIVSDLKREFSSKKNTFMITFLSF